MKAQWQTWFPAGVALSFSLMVAPGQSQAEPAQGFRFGADERVRQEYFDHIPLKSGNNAFARQGENNYFRFRTRLWAEQDVTPDSTLRVRAVNELRSWNHPDVSLRPQRSTAEWPEEWVFDNLYLDLRKLAGGSLDLRIGRQDLNYGAGNVIAEGTPGDGSRTMYFNAIKATWKGIPGTGVDIFGTYNESEDELAVNPSDRDISGFPRAREGATESGGGIYVKNKSLPAVPLEAYLVYKREGAWEQTAPKAADGSFVPPTLSWQTLDASRGVIRYEQLDVGTLGVRLTPSFGEGLSGEVELAGQVGQRDETDVHGFLANAFLTRTLSQTAGKPALKAGISCLSGDNPKTGDDEGWNPVWARCPQWSDLLSFAWDSEESVNRWSNLMAPSVAVTLSPHSRWISTATVYYLRAFEDDGNGDGKTRGWLAKWRNDFKIAEGWLAARDKVTGHLQLEVLDPGDYYMTDDTAVFARWEVMYTF